MLEVVIFLFPKPHTRLHPPLLSLTLGFVYTLNCLGVDHQDNAFLSCLPPLAGGLVGLQSQEELGTYVDFYFLSAEIREDLGGKTTSTSIWLLSRLHEWKQLILVLRVCFSIQVRPEQVWPNGCSLVGSYGCRGLYSCPVKPPDIVILDPEEPADLANPMPGLLILSFENWSVVKTEL